jgi:hypothetical protein
MLAFASGIAQLATAGIWRVVLVGIFAASFLVLAVRLTVLAVINSNRRLHSALESYREVIADICLRNGQEFTESIYLTYYIGNNNNDDVVVERRTTWTRTRLVFRDTFLARSFELDVDVEGMKPELSVDDGSMYQLTWLPLLDRAGLPGLHGIVTFHPALRDALTWAIKYTSPKLWDPLRKTGHDFMNYRLRDAQINKLEATFVFPANATGCMVHERSGAGDIERTFDDSRNQYRVRWFLDFPKTNHAYVWDVGAKI